ncbi:MAG TPA: hypothetical protein VE869_17840, partial [Gemmatimonas sp.]|nr:hypothetical protein [Gemmatimonas sp.]
ILPTAQRTSSVTGSYSNRTSGPTLLNALTLPSHAGETATTSTSLSADFARLVSDVYLARTRLGISAQRTDASPTLAVPEGRVLVRSRLPDGRNALATLQFGGASALPLRTRQTILEAGQEVSWFLPTNAHRPKLAAGWRRDLFADESVPNALGSYAYNSLSDLQAGIPSSYHRTLSGTRWSAGSDYMWLAASDLWRMTGRIAFQYGARLEGTRSLDRPASNRTVLETFGVRTDRAPNAVAVLPRLGLMWNVGNARSIFGSTPSGALRATAGAYRAMLPLSTLGAALTGTGLPDATARLTCVGPATPVPNWASFLSDATTIPSACATGPVSSFADSRPNVAASAREYDSPQTWRGSIGYSRFDVKRVRVSVDAIYALTLRQASSVDLNFNGVPGLSLPAEGGRRTFAEGGRIHEASGMVDPLASRVDPRFSRVNVLEADQRAESRQLSVLFSTVGARPLRSRFFYVNYVLGHVRDRVRGFDAATGQHPSSAVWGTSAADVRHSLVATMSWMMKSETFLSVSGNLRSGTPFTPLVQGDVNGDGLFNDPAFVFSPENATDSAFSRAYSTLLTTGARPIRDCLTAQRGQIAHRNSCRGPWTSYLDIVLMAPMRDLSLPGRANVSVIVNNSLGALDQLVHGARNLRGWGQAAAPSPTLFAITGFDASTSRYRYAVNPAFGDERLARSVVRAPFAVTLQVSVPITPAPSIQELNDVLAPGRTRKGSALTVVQIKQRLMQTFFQPSAHILGAKDTLQLSAEQIKRIEAVHRPYAAGIDSIFGDLATALHGRPANYSVHQERRVVLAARQQAWARLEPVIDALRVLLTPDQKDLLPVFLSNLLLPSEFKRIRRLDGES